MLSRYHYTISLLFLFMASTASFAIFSESSNYQIIKSALSSGGGHSSSSSFQQSSLSGQSVIGRASSQNFSMDQGYHRGLSIEVAPAPDESGDMPARFNLGMIYPNPSNPSTTIEYEMPFQDNVVVKVFNLKGNLVTTLVNEVQAAGHHQTVWNGRNGDGKQVASGIYLVKMSAGHFISTRKITLLK